MLIGMMLILTALKLVWKGGKILMLSERIGAGVEDVKHDLERVPGVLSVHELHVWRLNEENVVCDCPHCGR
jgi:zinc transporter 1